MNPQFVRNILIISFLVLTTISCGVVPRSETEVNNNNWVPPDTERVDTSSVLTPLAGGNSVPNKSEHSEDRRMMNVNDKLYSAHQEWGGTPYRFGGNSKSGIDCSAFTQRILEEYFDKSIARSTREQLQEGAPIRRNQIEPGDLIFFRTDRGVLHVGIAMVDGDFLHASFSNGVMISNISENYWAGRYLGTRRIL